MNIGWILIVFKDGLRANLLCSSSLEGKIYNLYSRIWVISLPSPPTESNWHQAWRWDVGSAVNYNWEIGCTQPEGQEGLWRLNHKIRD